MSLIRIPPGATPEVQEAFRAIDDLLNRLLGGLNVDFNGRRVINAGDPLADQDYVTRAACVRMVRAAGGTINNDGTGIGQTGQASTSSSSSSSVQSSTTTLSQDLARVSLRA